ncbi:hypothetical protein PanWU01x14_309320 [Parasponia andersonii]|uniref:Uncharacterized protein n=1 Tax=Parasponia andersonii TaxID=3476 RepID=A0A2P5AQM4_PARAD|nr:hypothetical protein PanWU01x14_309320 [Parasponia andersonii]
MGKSRLLRTSIEQKKIDIVPCQHLVKCCSVANAAPWCLVYKGFGPLTRTHGVAMLINEHHNALFNFGQC